MTLHSIYLQSTAAGCFLTAQQMQLDSAVSDNSVCVCVMVQVDHQMLDPALNVTESECILLAKNYTVNTANVNGSPPANVWNFCATGICKYTFPNGTSGESISPYAGSHTASTCQFGFSSAVDNNEYVQPAYILPPGLGSAGERSDAVLCMLCCAKLAVLADKSGRNILPPGLGSAGERSCAVLSTLC